MPRIMKPKGYTYGHPLAMNCFNLDFKEMIINGMDFSISNYDKKVYYKMDHQGIIMLITLTVNNWLSRIL